MSVRVRFAPSPTGTLHLGSARTALYNWLYARHFGDDGTYVLRIEDTDQERSTADSVSQALRVFEWLGLDWDEGPRVGGPHQPYVQSERMHVYDERARQLHDSGAVFECFCTKQELEQARNAALADKRAPVYDGRCRGLSHDQREELRAEGRAVSLRFAVPRDGHTLVDDMIKGPTRFENALLGDFIVRRSDGMPVYNFAAAVDDIDMQITHVIRGDDHLSNTPRQVLLYEAFGAAVPRFAHVPMILGPDRQKLSKRHGAASVEDVAEAGFVAEAVRNYLALLGWSKDDETTVMTTAEIVEAFDVSRVNKSPAAFDMQKLTWLNGQHLRLASAQEFGELYEQWRARWLAEGDALHEPAHATDGATAAMLVQEKVETLRDVPPLIGFLAEPHAIDSQAWERLLKVDEAPRVLERAIALLEGLDDFGVDSIEQSLRGLCAELGLKPRVVFGPIRFAVTGRTISPGLFESISVLGRERTLERLRSAERRLSGVHAQ